jgi:hypothetical protein
MKLALLFAVFAFALFVVGCKQAPKDYNPYEPIREHVEHRPPSTPTPTPHEPLSRPLDPTGEPP